MTGGRRRKPSNIKAPGPQSSGTKPRGAPVRIGGIVWPPLFAGPEAGVLSALLGQLEATQWLPQAELVQLQHLQLRALAQHAARQSTHFKDRLVRAGLRFEDLGSAEGLARLGVLRRRDIQAAGAALYCTDIPRDHAPVGTTQTSGSTGEPVVVRRTGVSRLFWMAMIMREHLWHRRDFTKRISAIRANIPEYIVGPDWGPPVSLLFRSGPAQGIPITADIEQQVTWLREFGPDNLVIYPSTLDALSRYCEAHNITLDGLTQVRTIGETLSPRIREQATRILKARVIDNYSSQEVGNIAFQCPDSDLYHVMAESLIVEVLNDAGRPCNVGEAGRIVVTDLHNYATPLIRYDIGDYAEVAAPCPCGRGLPALKRILGRERNLILMPDGSRHWPLVGFARFRDVAPVVQYQFIQTDRQSIEVRLVTESTMTRDQEVALGAVIQEALGYPFALTFRYFEDGLPTGPRGKFEEFICQAS